MCDARKIDFDQLIKNSSLLKTIPTRQEMKDEILKTFYELYSYAPSSAAYMERIVYRLAEEYRGDPVRVAILKKFILGGGAGFKTYDTTAVIEWAVNKMSGAAREAYDRSDEETRLELVVRELDDSIYSKEHLSVELTNMEMLDLMVWRWERLCAEIGQVQTAGIYRDTNGRARQQLHNFCKAQKIEFAKDDTTDVLQQKITDSLSAFCSKHEIPAKDCRDFVGTLETMIAALRKRNSGDVTDAQMEYVSNCFGLLMRKTVYQNQTGNEATADQLFRTDVRDARNKKNRWELLQVCNGLAMGNFKNNGNTRICLYQFAIMFGMTIALKDGDERDPVRDISKNLFEDFYCDNMARFLDAEFNESKYARTIEREPSGEGINLKNFAEAIYIYYLYRQDLKLTPGQRIDQAQRDIEKCIRNAKKENRPVTTEQKRVFTSVYRQQMVDVIIDAEPAELVDKVGACYHIDPQGAIRTNQFSDTNKAFEILSKSMDEVEKGNLYAGDAPLDYGSNEDAKQLNDDLIEDIWFESDAFGTRWGMAGLLTDKYREDKCFVRLVQQIDQRLSAEIDWLSGRKINLLSNILHVLCLASPQQTPIGLETMERQLYKKEAALTGNQIVDSVEILKDLGFDVHRVMKKDESHFYLGQHQETDALRMRILEHVRFRYRYDERQEEQLRQQLFRQLISEREYLSHKITRTKLITVLTSRYLADVQDRNDLNSLPEIYDDFKASLEPGLIESRFQPLNEKNMLDMYVILSVYLYLVEHGKGDDI